MPKIKIKSLNLAASSLILLIGVNSVVFAADAETPPEIIIDSPPGIEIKTSCTENALIDNDSRLCQNGSYLLCVNPSTEGIKSKDLTKECKNGKWIAYSSGSNPPPPGGSNPPPPGGTGTNPPPPIDTDTKIKITKADVYPKGFNPTVSSAKITYAINKEAIIEIKIVDSSGQTVVKLIDDKKISKGEYSVNWYGTLNNELSGTVANPGTYEYKITARNTISGNVEDTEDGEMNLIYFNLVTDNGFNGTTNTSTQNQPVDSGQARATQTLQNSISGITAKTGPGILIYFLFPLAGHLLSRKLKR